MNFKKVSLITLFILGTLMAGCGNKEEIIAAKDKSSEFSMALIRAYANDNNQTVPTVQDYKNIGATGVNTANLVAVNTAIVRITNDIDIITKIQTIVTRVDKSMKLIATYADDSTQTAPTIADYANVGINTTNIVIVNAGIAAVTSSDVNTVQKIQTIATTVDEAMRYIIAYADGNTQTEPTIADYLNAGVTGVTRDNLTAINANISIMAGNINTVQDIQHIVISVALEASKAMRVIADYANDNRQPVPTIINYVNAGVTGVNITNIAAVNAGIAAVTSSDVDTVQKIQMIVRRVNLTMDLIARYADDDNTQVSPIVENYNDIGIKGVHTANLAAVNAGIATMTKADVDSVAKIQTIVNQFLNPLPANIIITDANLNYAIVSTDNTPYEPAIDIQGKINMNATPKGVMIKVPYNRLTDETANLPAFKSSFTIESNSTQDMESGIIATFAWQAQTLSGESGTFDAFITIDDSAGNNDHIFNAKKLKIDIANGVEIASFRYPLDNIGHYGMMKIKIYSGIKDRNFNTFTNNRREHQFLYLPVTNFTTGRTWLNNNLGAEYADVNNPNGHFNKKQQATASNDYLAYGSLFQWGRKADGHELIDWSNHTTGSGRYGTTNKKSNNPSNSLFIIASDDWRVDSRNYLWVIESSANNVCPAGYLPPTKDDFVKETQGWISKDSEGALQSVLKMTMAGDQYGKIVKGAGEYGRYWERDFDNGESHPHLLRLEKNAVYTNNYDNKVFGYSVRCVKEHDMGIVFSYSYK